VGDNDAGEKVEFTAQREVEATAYIGANYAFEILSGLLDGLAHLALDAIGHQVKGCEEFHRCIGTEVSYYSFALF
jgi:hypothetical protein